MNFETYSIHIAESAIVVIVYFVLKAFVRKAINKVGNKFSKSKTRVKIVKKIINLILLLLSFTLLILIWGVKQSELMYFVTSLLTVLGIAFFAQWSIISNITSTLIIFFNHPAKIGDTIEVYDKDYPLIGEISDIGVFFVIIKTEGGSLMTIPSNVFIQKMIIRKDLP